MSHERFAFSRVAAATVALLILIATRPAVAAEPTAGGSLSLSIETDLPTLDPAGFASFNDREAGVILYDTLLDLDPKGQIVPHLAEKIDAAPDATWFRITLRRDVKFHDGTPLDATAVVAHFQRMMDPKVRCRCLSDLATVDTIEATGPQEVTFKMKTPSAHFPSVLADFAGMITSPAGVEKYKQDFGANPVGSGPFMFKEWQRGARIVFVRNPNYWQKGKPFLDEVVLRPLPDQQTRYASLKSGSLDIVMNAGARDVIDARESKAFKIINAGSLASVFVMINIGRPDVSDVRVREAMAHALDRAALNKAINRGLYKIANTPFGSGLAPHEAVDNYPDYNLDKARKLIAAYGKPVKIKMTVNATPLAILTAQALQQMWKKAGIETEIEQVEQVQGIRMAAAKDYQVMLYRWAGGGDPDKNVHQFFHSKGTVNRTNYNNADMDRILDEARATTDPAARLKLYRQVNNLLARDLPYLFLNYFDNYAIANPSVNGIVAVPDGLIRVDRVWKSK
jgi:ABC-type transport system substrate-binding protein